MENINVFYGPMKCGKTSKLIKLANDFSNEGKNIKVFKPLMDNRFSNDEVVDRNGNKISSINIEKIEDIENYDADIYLIDEFQFLNGNLDSIKGMAKRGKKFYIAGLDLTAEKKPFGKMGEIIDASDNKELLNARCDNCGSPNAIYTYCTIKKSGDILIGDSEYLAVCDKCYSMLTKENL